MPLHAAISLLASFLLRETRNPPMKMNAGTPIPSDSRSMKLRDCPLMMRSGRSIWPPKWTTTRKFDLRPRGEIGTLEDVFMNGRRCFLVIRHEGRTYLGGLTLSNSPSAQRIFEFLKQHIGRPIKEIGDREFSLT